MYVKIHGNRDYIKGNSQSCRELAEYLEKENQDKPFPDKEYFFSHSATAVDSNSIISAIDNNRKGLKDKEAKFFMVTINPSQNELKHIARLVTGRDNIQDISYMSKVELSKYNSLVKQYAKNVMEEYAKGFNKGITGEDLVYFAKLEQERHYKGTDKEVIENKAVSGEKKEGLQTHVHVIVSRKDKTQKISLSPLANARGGNNHKLNGKTVRVGMDRDNFVKNCEACFDKQFSYSRDIQNHYEYHKHVSKSNILKAFSLADNHEQGLKNITLSTADKMFQTNTAKNINSVTNLLQNPESAKDILINKLESILDKSLPPTLRVAKKVIEKTIEKGMSI